MSSIAGVRTLTAARKEQGFKSQAHLDSFYAYFDHTQSCPDCGPGKAVFIDDSWQGTQNLCPIGLELDRLSLESYR